jgi:protease I
MVNQLNGKRIAFLTSNAGVEEIELTSPWQAVLDAGGLPVLIAPEAATVHTVNGDIKPGEDYTADLAVADTSPNDFAGLVLPGGVANPDKLRLVPEAVEFVRRFALSGKPVAAICHGPWTLVEANVVHGKTLTSWPSLHTDIANAGAEWRDEEVFTCDREGYTLVTSRKPDDLPAFNAAVVKALSA